METNWLTYFLIDSERNFVSERRSTREYIELYRIYAPQEHTGRVGCTKLRPGGAECNYEKTGNNEFKPYSSPRFSQRNCCDVGSSRSESRRPKRSLFHAVTLRVRPLRFFELKNFPHLRFKIKSSLPE